MNNNLAPKNSNDKRTIIRQSVLPAAKAPQRENTFSQSRDIREDRGMRQLKTSNGANSFPPRRPVTAIPSRSPVAPNQNRKHPTMKHNRNHDNAPNASAQLVPVHFTFDHPTATSVCVAGTFNEWHPTTKAMQMRAVGSGHWLKEAFLPPGDYEYCLVVDGQWMPDPLALKTVPNPYGGQNSILNVACSPEAAHRTAALNLPLKNTNKQSTRKL
jgi:hypothetical protein